MIHVRPSISATRIASGRTDASAATVSTRWRIRSALVSGAIEEAPRTRNSTWPSTSTGAVSICLLGDGGFLGGEADIEAHRQREAREERRQGAGPDGLVPAPPRHVCECGRHRWTCQASGGPYFFTGGG